MKTNSFRYELDTLHPNDTLGILPLNVELNLLEQLDISSFIALLRVSRYWYHLCHLTLRFLPQHFFAAKYALLKKNLRLHTDFNIASPEDRFLANKLRAAILELNHKKPSELDIDFIKQASTAEYINYAYNIAIVKWLRVKMPLKVDYRTTIEVAFEPVLVATLKKSLNKTKIGLINLVLATEKLNVSTDYKSHEADTSLSAIIDLKN